MVKQHQSKNVKKLVRKLRGMGFTVIQTRNGCYRITPPPGVPGPIYTTHGTESSLHPIRRDFKKLYNIDLRSEDE